MPSNVVIASGAGSMLHDTGRADLILLPPPNPQSPTCCTWCQTTIPWHGQIRSHMALPQFWPVLHTVHYKVAPNTHTYVLRAAAACPR